MRPSLALLSARVHKPLINFIGRRRWPPPPTPSHPHPAAPPEYRKTFSSVLQETRTTTKTAEQSFNDFWDAPARLWRPKHHELPAIEIDAVQSGGASLL